jgi:hypothetical protein
MKMNVECKKPYFYRIEYPLKISYGINLKLYNKWIFFYESHTQKL